MGLGLKAAELLSRRIRLNLSNGRIGADLITQIAALTKVQPRKIGSLTKLRELAKPGNLVEQMWNAAKGIAGFIGGLFKAVSFSATAIWSWVISAVQGIKQFDWNATDKALRESLESQKVGLAAIWGSVVGSGLGWLAGISVGYGIGFVCPVIGGAALARNIATAVARETVEEFIPQLKAAILGTGRMLATNLLINGYINVRRWLKTCSEDQLSVVFGKDTARFIRNVWGNQGGPNMSFNTITEEALERINDKALRAFLEQVLEESWDSFTEAGFIIAHELDEAFSQHKLSQQAQLGTHRTVVLEPDTQAEEQLTFSDVPQNLLMPAVQSTINTHRLIHNRDVGLLVGMPVEDYARAKPQSLRIVISMVSLPKPPYSRKSGKKLVRVTLTVPDLKRSALDWERIKLACGGHNGYLWGRFRATANLDNGRQMAVYGGSEEAAEERLKALLALSNAKLVTLSVSEEKKEGKVLENPKLFKATTQVYPAFFTIINREEILETNKGDASLSQNYIDRKGRIPLWTDKEPANFNEIINRLLRKGV